MQLYDANTWDRCPLSRPAIPAPPPLPRLDPPTESPEPVGEDEAP